MRCYHNCFGFSYCWFSDFLLTTFPLVLYRSTAPVRALSPFAVRRPPCTFRLLCCMNFGYLTPQRKSINIIFHACLAVLYGACGHSCCCQSRPAPLHALLLSSLRPAPAIFIALSLCSYRFFVCQYFSLRLFLTKYIAVIAFIAFWLVHCGYCNFFSLLFLPLSFLWLARF